MCHGTSDKKGTSRESQMGQQTLLRSASTVNAKCERAHENYDAPVYHMIQSFLSARFDSAQPVNNGQGSPTKAKPFKSKFKYEGKTFNE